jgi:hypothetical protein
VIETGSIHGGRSDPSSSVAKKAQKEKDLLAKQQAELQAFDEELNHYANERISLDLDDGVKVNYAKFGTLLADGKKSPARKATTDPCLTIALAAGRLRQPSTLPASLGAAGSVSRSR